MFPFSPLPLLPQELILKELDPVDIFFFSLISRKSHLLAKRFKLAVKRVEWIVEKGVTDINVIGTRDYTLFELRTPSSEPETESELPKFKAQKDGIKFSSFLGTYSWQVNYTPGKKYPKLYITTSENIEDLAEAISKRLLDVLRPQTFYLRVDECLIPLYIFRFTRTFNEVWAHFSDEQLFTNHALILLNEINTDYLYMGYYSALKVPKNLILKHRRIRLFNVSWFTKDLLMNMECEELWLNDPCNLTPKDFKEFFEKWKEGKFSKLKEIHINNCDISDWTLNLAPVDEKGLQVFSDVGGNVGKLLVKEFFLVFLVNLDFEFED